jgi:hypothetical protein
MLHSLYPTDPPSVREAVIEQAVRRGDELMFTSLHLPEHDGLAEHGALLRDLHRAHGITFCGDISPLTLERLGGGDDAPARLRDWGIAVLRIDFGFAPEQVRRIAEQTGTRIAVNASTATAAELDALDGLPLIGWHNYYPRPETGLSTATYRDQDDLFRERGLPLYAFVPGESTFRAPLGLGLPMLEEQRGRTVWRNYLQLRRLSPASTVVCAEGVVAEEHLDWIEHAERTGEVTVPLTGLDPAVRFLLDGAWSLRVDGAEVSFRLEGTRSDRTPVRRLNADLRTRGSLQMDLPDAGRYQGEVHLMRADRPLHPWQARVADVAAPYAGIVDDLRPGQTLRFVPFGPG